MGSLISFNFAKRLYDKHSPIKYAIRNAEWQPNNIDDYKFHMKRARRSFKWGSSIIANKFHLSMWILNLYNVFFISFVWFFDGRNTISSIVQLILCAFSLYFFIKYRNFDKQKQLMDKL